MRPLAILLCLLHLACAIDTSTSEQALGASWYDVRDECRRVCSVVYAQQCPLVNQTWWWPACLDSCTRLADEAQEFGCLDQAEDWQRCEWSEQERTCIDIYPYTTTNNCHAEVDTYMACRSDS